MKNRPDAFERLQAANPVDPATVDRPDSPRAQQLLASILATPRTPEPAVVRRRRRRLVIAVALVAVLGGAATWIITRPVTNPAVVSCYAQPALHGTQAGLAGVPLDVESCAPYWEDGTLTNPDYPAGTVPPLVACVTDVGTFAVFPSDDPNLCGNLGLALPEMQSIEDAKPTLDLDHAISDYFATDQCIPIPQAVDDIRSILDRHDASDWTITIGERRPDRPCASLSFEPKTRTIRIVPIPEP
ncbi:hypothetical protein BMS3Abin02_00194 [bacterium BMS3Abin02]|nr:hypothetical protein BMS3Abin02_00194 [bacterium BMS3Abin02]